MIYAVVPAAGRSTRMGRPKLLLPLGGVPVLRRVVDALRAGGVDRAVVVVAPRATKLARLAEDAGAIPCVLAEETPDMRATVACGLHHLEERFHPAPDDAWLLVPADHPTLSADTVRRLTAPRTAEPHFSIFLPTVRGRRGHPALVGWSHAAAVHAMPPGEGLNHYLRRQAAATCEVPVADPDILVDLDTPEDYERLRREWDGRAR